MQHYSIALIPGDGIGPEVISEAVKVLKSVEQIHGGISFSIDSFDWGCEYYQRYGKMMAENGLDILKDFDSILFGAVGSKSVPDHISVWELILPIRRHFQQYVNLRPIKLLKGLESPLRNKSHEDLNFTVIRENSEGEYSNTGGRLHEGTPFEMAIQNNIFTRNGSERILDYAYSMANKSKDKNLAIATKSNAMNHTMPFWDEVAKEIGTNYPDVKTNFYHIDALAAHFISKPETLDVVVGSNLFGDILTDLGAAIVGGLGMAPSGNINPDRTYPSMFEPIHGSAPDISGKGIANPIASIWSLSLMMDYFEIPSVSKLILDSIEGVLIDSIIRTPDLGGVNTTNEMGDAIISKMSQLSFSPNT